MIALRRDHQLLDAFVFDDMLRKTVLTKKLDPVGVEEQNAAFPRPVQDSDIYTLMGILQSAGLESVGHGVVHQAVEVRSKELRTHPIRNYLNSLSWDGTERLGTWLHVYAGAERSVYTEAVGSMFLIGLVARVFKPGCKADYMLILEGLQGLQKSGLCRVLADKWFSDSLPDIRNGNKDLSSHLNGKWLIEVAELTAVSKSDQNALKAFLTRTTEQFRPAYGRNEADYARQCLFVGTTNLTTYLRDSTGGRRNWPVKTSVVSPIDLIKLKEDRDQLFAEAVSRFKAGENWWPTREFEAEHMVPEQDARRVEDAWTPPVAKFLVAKGRTTIAEVATDCIGVPLERLGQREQRRVGTILADLGWIQHRSAKERWWGPADR